MVAFVQSHTTSCPVHVVSYETEINQAGVAVPLLGPNGNVVYDFDSQLKADTALEKPVGIIALIPGHYVAANVVYSRAANVLSVTVFDSLRNDAHAMVYRELHTSFAQYVGSADLALNISFPMVEQQKDSTSCGYRCIKWMYNIDYQYSKHKIHLIPVRPDNTIYNQRYYQTNLQKYRDSKTH